MIRALVIYCHPLLGAYNEAVREAALAGLSSAAEEIRVTDLYADGFNPEATTLDSDGRCVLGDDPLPVGYAADLAWCDTLVLIYPTWWAGQPAMLKGWIDRVWVEGVAWESAEGPEKRQPLLGNIKRLVAISTHGSSKSVNMLEGEGGKRTFTRGLAKMCHRRARTTWLALYGIDTSSLSDRESFLAKVERQLSRLP